MIARLICLLVILISIHLILQTNAYNVNQKDISASKDSKHSASNGKARYGFRRNLRGVCNRVRFVIACYFGDFETVQSLAYKRTIQMHSLYLDDASMYEDSNVLESQRSLLSVPLYLAIKSKNPAVVTFLISHGVSFYRLSLIDAIKAGRQTAILMMKQWSLRNIIPAVPKNVAVVIEIWNGVYSGDMMTALTDQKNSWRLAMIQAALLCRKTPKKFYPTLRFFVSQISYTKEFIVRKFIHYSIEGNNFRAVRLLFPQYVSDLPGPWCWQFDHFIEDALKWKRFAMVKFFLENMTKVCSRQIGFDIFFFLTDILQKEPVRRYGHIFPVLRILYDLFDGEFSFFRCWDKVKEAQKLATILPRRTSMSRKEHCCICLESFCRSDIHNNSIIQTCRRTHHFHRRCLNEYFLSQPNNKCPLCRRNVILPDERQVPYPWMKPKHRIPFPSSIMRHLSFYFLFKHK